MKVTNQEIKMNFMDEDIVIPKGTETTHQTALGISEHYNFVSDFSWYKPHLTGFARKMAIHDMAHYGIDIPKDKIEIITDSPPCQKHSKA